MPLSQESPAHGFPVTPNLTPFLHRQSFLRISFLLLFTFGATLAHAQQYTSIVVFGDSLSDTGNVADLTQAAIGARIPGPIADYTDGRFTDGTDTVPAAHNYNGVWVEQLAAMLPGKPVVKSSLDGGTDYAYGLATTGRGTSVFTFGPGDVYSVSVENVGQQITEYLGTHPKIDNKTLFIVWGGAIDLLHATSTNDVVNAAIAETGNIQRLIQAGATQFLIPNLPPLGAIPRLSGSVTTSKPATEAAALYNIVLSIGLDVLKDVYRAKHPQLRTLDTFSLFTRILFAPSLYGFANVTGSAQGNYLVNPDTYLFWDDLHPTTYGHNLLALSAARLIAGH